MTKQHSVIITWQPRQEKKNIKCLLHFAHSELYPKRQHNEKIFILTHRLFKTRQLEIVKQSNDC